MVIRLHHVRIDIRKLAALLTPSLLSPNRDDAPTQQKPRPGSNWLRWGDANHSARAHLN